MSLLNFPRPTSSAPSKQTLLVTKAILCFQAEGYKLYKDLKSFLSAVKGGYQPGRTRAGRAGRAAVGRAACPRVPSAQLPLTPETLEGPSNFLLQPHPASLTENSSLWLVTVGLHHRFLRHLVVGLSSLLSVMHESSKRVSETLQEVYSSDWDGHEELKAIVGVRAAWA